jgi:hypothetical protein
MRKAPTNGLFLLGPSGPLKLEPIPRNSSTSWCTTDDDDLCSSHVDRVAPRTSEARIATSFALSTSHSSGGVDSDHEQRTELLVYRSKHSTAIGWTPCWSLPIIRRASGFGDSGHGRAHPTAQMHRAATFAAV